MTKFINGNKPPTKEALYYRMRFRYLFGISDYDPLNSDISHYLNNENIDTIIKFNDDLVIPYYWLPRWVGNITEPSARILNL